MNNIKSTNPIIGTGLKTLSKIKDGSVAATLELTNDSHVIPCDEYGENGNYSACETTVNYYLGNILDESAIIDTPVVGPGINREDYTWTPKTRTLKLNNMRTDESYVDFSKGEYTVRFSVSKVRNGGGAFLMDLTNDNHTFVSDALGNISNPTPITTEVLVYKGTERWEIEDVVLPKVPTGLNCMVLYDKKVQITPERGNKLAPSGVLDIHAKIKLDKDGDETTVLKKTFSWSKTRDGNGITTVEEYYKANNMLKGVSSPKPSKEFVEGTDGWYKKVPELNSRARYLWNFERVLYNTDEVTHTEAAMIGSYSEDGDGITRIENYYLATNIKEARDLPVFRTNIGTGIPSDEGKKWTTKLQIITSERKYLWNIEKIYYSKKDPVITEPALIGVYGDQGEPGDKGESGDDGRGIARIEEFYLATSLADGVTSDTSRFPWTQNVKDAKMSDVNKYLWNFERKHYTFGYPATEDTNPVVIGIYEKGVGIRDVIEYYLATNESKGITNRNPGFTTDIEQAKTSPDRRYLWNYEETIYTDNSRYKTPAVIIGVHGGEGKPGAGYTLSIGGGVREVSYAANGSSPEPSTLGVYKLEFSKNGQEVSPEYIKWTCGGNVELNGLTNQKTFSPRLSQKYKKGEESYVSVVVRETSSSVEISCKIPVSCNKHAGGLDWIEEWDDNTTEINDERIITPKIFAGKSGEYTDGYGNKFYRPTGVAIGRDMFGTGTPNIGIAGYKNNVKTFHLDTNGDLWMGNNSGFLQFNDRGFELKVSKLNIGGIDATGITSGIKKIDVEYCSADSPDRLTGYEKWTTDSPKWEKGKFIWTKTTTYYFNGTNKTVGPTCISGRDGKGINYIQEKYLMTNSRTIKPNLHDSGWTTSVPTLSVGQYIWTKNVIFYLDGTKDEVGPVCASGEDGIGLFVVYNESESKPNRPSTDNGVGSGWVAQATERTVWVSQQHARTPNRSGWSDPIKLKGADGKGIISTTIEYAASSSGTVAPNVGWLLSVPSVSQGQFLWTRTTVTYTSGPNSVSYSVGKMGQNGTNGNDGKGIKKVDIEYQVSSSGDTPPGGRWLPNLPPVPLGQYLWSRTTTWYTDGTNSVVYTIGRVGQNGQNGNPGPPGPPGPKLPWLEDWEDNGMINIGSNYVISPRIFAGTKDYYGNITGVAIGKNVFGTNPYDGTYGRYANLTGIAGYKGGNKMFHLDENGNFMVGDSRNYLKFIDGNFEICASNIKFSAYENVRDIINNKANQNEVNSLSSRLTIAENGIRTKVESSTYNSKMSQLDNLIETKVSNSQIGSIVEQKMTSETIINKVSSGINNGDSLTTSTTILDRTGLTVKGGHFTFLDKFNDMALSHQGGGLYTQGGIQAAVAPHNKPKVRGETLSYGSVSLHSWKINHETFNNLPLIISTNSGLTEFRDMLDTRYTNARGHLFTADEFNTAHTSDNGTVQLIRNEVNARIGRSAWCQLWLNEYTDDPSKTSVVIGNGRGKGEWGHLQAGSIHVKGDKNCVQDTKNYGCRAINAYETAEYYFGDIGEGIIGEDGLCYITIEDIFSEVVNTKHIYQVFLQKYGNGDVWIKNREENYFIVEGTPNTSFAWEIKAKRRGYESNRMELVGGSIIKMTDEPIYEL